MSKTLWILGIVVIAFAACNDSSQPGYQYMADMGKSIAYDYDESNPFFADSLNGLPVEGTIPRGYNAAYYYENTPEGYEQAGTEVVSPFDEITPEMLAEGKVLYNIYCTPCHGKGGEGDGTLTEYQIVLKPTSYLVEPLLSLSDGKMYHTIMHGKNMMGSYASQINHDERWKVIAYINSLQDKATGNASADTAE